MACPEPNGPKSKLSINKSETHGHTVVFFPKFHNARSAPGNLTRWSSNEAPRTEAPSAPEYWGWSTLAASVLCFMISTKAPS